MLLFLPLQFENGSKLSLAFVKEKPGIFWPESPATVRPEKIDYGILVDQVIDAITGIITTYKDSQHVFKIFQQLSATGTRTLLFHLKNRAGEFNETPESVLRRLFDTLSADHREAFKDLLIERNIVEDLTAIVAADLLEDHESEELHRWLVRFHGDALDRLLLQLEQQSQKDQRQSLLFIIENLDTLPAEQARRWGSLLLSQAE